MNKKLKTKDTEYSMVEKQSMKYNIYEENSKGRCRTLKEGDERVGQEKEKKIRIEQMEKGELAMKIANKNRKGEKFSEHFILKQYLGVQMTTDHKI